MPRSRSLTRFTMRVGLEHFGQSVLLDVSIIFCRSAVLAIFAMSNSFAYRGLECLTVPAPNGARLRAAHVLPHPALCVGKGKLARASDLYYLTSILFKANW